MSERDLRLPCQVYCLRMFGLARELVCIATVCHGLGASPAASGPLARTGQIA